MSQTPTGAGAGMPKIRIAVSTSALFDMRVPGALYKADGSGAYRTYMERTRDIPLRPGHAFEVIKWLSDFSKANGECVEIVLASRNDSVTIERAYASLQHYDIDCSHAVFTNGQSSVEYLKDSYDVDWLITTDGADAQRAQQLGMAACMIDSPVSSSPLQDEFSAAAADSHVAPPPKRRLHLVWDFDRVLFDDSADKKFTELGLKRYREHEFEHARVPLGPGPFTKIARLVSEIAAHFPEGESPIVNSGLTARGNQAIPRAINTLRALGLNFNGEVHCACGYDKSRVLRTMRKNYPDDAFLFLDDSQRTIEKTRAVVPSGLVPADFRIQAL
jgi:5'-nucleotidase